MAWRMSGIDLGYLDGLRLLIGYEWKCVRCGYEAPKTSYVVTSLTCEHPDPKLPEHWSIVDGGVWCGACVEEVRDQVSHSTKLRSFREEVVATFKAPKGQHTTNS